MEMEEHFARSASGICRRLNQPQHGAHMVRSDVGFSIMSGNPWEDVGRMLDITVIVQETISGLNGKHENQGLSDFKGHLGRMRDLKARTSLASSGTRLLCKGGTRGEETQAVAVALSVTLSRVPQGFWSGKGKKE